jgi:hypothetical protein
VIERAVVDGSSSCSDQNFCCTTASRLKRPQTPTRAARRARATSPGPMLRAAAVAATTAPRAIAPRARRGRGVPATRRTRVFARAGGDDDADDDADDAPTPAGKLDGGKYGMGGRIDDALDASTNETSFVLGGFLLTLSAIALFAFGPRPPTEY